MLRNKANFIILDGFLSELLNDNIKIECVIESEGNRTAFDDKTNIVDILIKNSKGVLVIVDVQTTLCNIIYCLGCLVLLKFLLTTWQRV